MNKGAETCCIPSSAPTQKWWSLRRREETEGRRKNIWRNKDEKLPKFVKNINLYILWAEWIPGRYIIIKNQRQRFFFFKKFFQIQAVVGISKLKFFSKYEVTHIYPGNVKNIHIRMKIILSLPSASWKKKSLLILWVYVFLRIFFYPNA